MIKKQSYWVYILLVSNGHYYTGYTTDIKRRYKEHLSGNTKFTRSFPPVEIKQCWKIFEDKGTAMKIEKFIKSRPRKIKEEIVENNAYIQQDNDDLIPTLKIPADKMRYLNNFHDIREDFVETLIDTEILLSKKPIEECILFFKLDKENVYPFQRTNQKRM